MYFDTNFGIVDLIVFVVVVSVFLLMTEFKLFGIENTVFGGVHKYYTILLFGIIFTLLNHIKF
jgi:hypothetical protein